MKKQQIKIVIILSFAVFLTAFKLMNSPTQFFDIPTQKINLYKILGIETITSNDTVNAFQISGMVTYKEYKIYLMSVKKDSSEKFYKSQLPDTNIGNKAVYEKYISSTDYDDFPVIGVSWENAMNYCKWKTLQENKEGIHFIYCLPKCSEWLAAYSYLSDKKITNDFNKNYSDWLLNTMEEADHLIAHSDSKDNTNPFDYFYFHKKTDPPVLKRKVVMGDSYLFQQNKLLNYFSYSYYATQGYRQVSFRYVKCLIKQGTSNETDVLKYWGIKK